MDRTFKKEVKYRIRDDIFLKELLIDALLALPVPRLKEVLKDKPALFPIIMNCKSQIQAIERGGR